MSFLVSRRDQNSIREERPTGIARDRLNLETEDAGTAEPIVRRTSAPAAVSIAFAKGACVCGAPRRGKVRSAGSKKPEAMTSLGKLTGKA